MERKTIRDGDGKVVRIQATDDPVRQLVPVQVGGLVVIPVEGADEGEEAKAHATGEWKGAKETGSIEAGATVGWKSDGDPHTGTEGSGAYTDDPDEWDFRVGTALRPAGSFENYVAFLLNR